LLRCTSVYFSGLFRYGKTWLESRSGVVRLEDIEANAFAVYQLWLETGSIGSESNTVQEAQQQEVGEPVENQEDGTPHDGEVVVGNKTNIFETAIDERVDLLTHCYLLGDYIGAPGFQNDVIDEISRFYADVYNTDSQIPLYNIGYICHKTTFGSRLRHFVVDALSCGLSKKTLTEAAEWDLIPLDVVVAIAGNAMDDKDEPWNNPHRCLPWQANPCQYHVHPVGDFNSPCSDPYTWNCEESGKWDVKPWEQNFIGNVSEW
jgi:hypothetical protein